MSTGDQADFVNRLQTTLPLRWFPDEAPVLNGVLNGLAAAWAALWQNLQFIIAQTRINTASGEWLDAIAADFFAGQIMRYTGESDTAFRARILAALLRARGTRAGLIAALTTVTGTAPLVFEFVDIRDTGGWGGAATAAGLFYSPPGAALGVRANGAGGWGNTGLAFQAVATIPQVSGGPGVPVDEIQVSVADVAPCCGVVWLNAYDQSGTLYLETAQYSSGAWSITTWSP